MKIKNPVRIFAAAVQEGNGDFFYRLMNRHNHICIYDGKDNLLEKLAQLPARPGLHNSMMLELLIDFINQPSLTGNFPQLNEFEALESCTTPEQRMQYLFRLYIEKTKPGADVLLYRIREPQTLKNLFENYMLKNNGMRFIHITKDDQESNGEHEGYHFLASLANGVLEVCESDFIRNYGYEYKRLFAFINPSQQAAAGTPKKKYYSKPVKLKDIRSEWYDAAPENNVPVEIKIQASKSR